MSIFGSQSNRRQPPVADTDGVTARRHRPDYVLVLCIAMLLAVGLVVIYSVSPAISARLVGDVDPNHFMYRQMIFLLLGFSVFAVTSYLPLKYWRVLQKYILWFAIGSFFLLLVPFFSINYGGATRWVSIGPFNYQPAELLKFGLVFAMALFFARRIKDRTLDTAATMKAFLIIFVAVSLEIVILQKDMGTMIPIAAILLAMLFLSGISSKRFLAIVAVIAIGGALAIAGAGHRRARVFTFLNPDADKSGSGYHINQALIAVGSGGVVGKGLGRSVQAYGYLPEAANDSIVAIMAEKFGFIGMLVIFAIYGVLLFRLILLTERAPNVYLRLVSGGIFAWMSVQAFVNIGAMLGIMPLTGVTLPLLSFGGTSLIFTLAALGVAFNISRYTRLGDVQNEEQTDTSSARRRGLGRPRYAA
ncbi:FtsW/RodA/SpoVE family cell cycle protein [Candidatus Saccharibacteria bacterium]|nr:FtsW/RodA/SpoVE family cell cycle protein [Candidatus Saccharibacteria bacterium]